jgi:hypothetical protein
MLIFAKKKKNCWQGSNHVLFESFTNVVSALCGNDNKVKSKLLRPFSDVDALLQIFLSARSKFIIFI